LSYILETIGTSSSEYSWGNIVYPHALYNPDTGKFYLATAKKSDGKAYLVEIDKNGNVRELQLQMPVYPDTTYGSGDCHIIPAIIWLDDSKTKIVAVGGDHVGGSFHIEIINVETWESEKVIDSGIHGTYHILIRKSTGEIIIFYRNNDNGYLYYVKYNPSDDSISSAVQVTSNEAKGFSFGYDYDNNKYVVIVTPDWSNRYFMLFDAESEKFYDLNGNELTLPVDSTTLVGTTKNIYNVVIVNNKLVFYINSDHDNDGVTEMLLVVTDRSLTTLGKIEIADVTTDHKSNYRGFVLNDGLETIYFTKDKIVYGVIDPDTPQITNTIEITPEFTPFRGKEVYVDIANNSWNTTIAIAVKEDTNTYTDEIVEASNPSKLYVVYATTPQPLFSITNYPSTISGTPSETKTVNITVANNGDTDGDCTIRIKDHNGTVVAEQTKTIVAGSSETYSLSITLPSSSGTYTWTIEAYNVSTSNVDDTKSFTVEVSETPAPSTDILNLVRLCFMTETLKALRRPREGEQAPEPDYTKCINIYVMSILIQRLSQTT